MKIRFEYFWPGFIPKDFFLLKYFENPEIVLDNSYDYLILSVFPYKSITIKNTAKIIVFNGEHPDYIKNRIISLGIKPTIQLGFIDSYLYDYNVHKLYFPLWLLYYPNFNHQFINDIELKKDITIEELDKRKFCCLINSHDMKNTRKPIYNLLSKINNVDCPGILLNNVDRQLVGTTTEDKVKFMSSYIFNICSENYLGSLYVTEKLIQALHSCCIPIYYGDISNINSKIFNLNRIIVVNDFSSESMLLLKNKITNLFNNKNNLLNFYKQPIFNSNAINDYNNFIKEFEYNFNNCCK